MKKFFSLMVACAALFAACETDTTGDDVNNNGGNNNGGENNGKKEALATPTLEVKDVLSTSFTVTWAAVENAESYMVTVGDAQPVTITETSYKLENLNAGTYTGSVIAVAGKDSKYSNSKAATFSQAVTGLTPEECNWAQCMASLPTEEDAYYNYFPFANIFHSFKGTGIVDIKNGAFTTAEYGDTPIADLVVECEGLSADYVEAANADGLTLVFNVQPATEYRVVAEITNEAGLTVIFDETITTAEAQPHPAMEAYVGTWNVSTKQALLFEMPSQDMSIVDKDMTTEVVVAPFAEYGFEYVTVTGLGVSYVDAPAIGMVQYDPKTKKEVLYIINEQLIGQSEDGSYYLGWATLGIISQPEKEPFINMVGGAYPSFTIVDGVGKGLVGELNGGGTFTACAMDVFGYVERESGLGVGLLFYGGETDEEDAYLYAGDQTWTRISSEIPEDNTEEETPATFSKGLNIRKATTVNMPSYVAL